MENLTIQAYQDHTWRDVALLKFSNAEQHNFEQVFIGYLREYALTNLDRDDEFAVSINYPVSLFFNFSTHGCLSFLDDLIPNGASRRF
ncbi:hypothetical protein [Thorsellia anophelis]|uniref:Serine/threonine-protein kinase HipA n=1 Tax=Thorsellia anophelis DSM 18579 TaxID=1123402 RepID=A0A1H9ZB19_9GAMM|nr:hypothetical protein [Thorsellia anophelis]SES78041.1 serine/threonine-protein kinase HipA [Thorsellia anophelis DSM 18579]